MSPKSHNSWLAFNKIEFSLELGINGNSVKALDMAISALESDEFRSYHAICSLYESMATFLVGIRLNSLANLGFYKLMKLILTV